MKTVFKIVLGILIASIVLIGGCAVLIGGAANQAQKDSDKHAISLAQYEAIHHGQSKSAVIAKFGEPTSSDADSLDLSPSEEAALGKGSASSSCIYYNRKGQLASIFQFCFDGNDQYESKSAL